MIVGVLMPEHNYKINISSDDGLGIPNIDAYFGRITVLLGANGTGKSRALKRLCDQFGTLQQAKKTLESKRRGKAADRAKDVFYLLERKDTEAKILHSDEVTKWKKGGCNGPCPDIQESQLGKLFTMFSEVFPEIVINLEGDDRRIMCYKNGKPYSPTELSDGERQVLFVLADIALCTE